MVLYSLVNIVIHLLEVFLDLNKKEKIDYLNVMDKKASTLVRTKSEPPLVGLMYLW